MFDSDKILQEMMQKLSMEIVANLRDNITQAIESEISRNLSKSIVESEFYRRLNQDMRQGLQNIYKEINSAKQGGGSSSASSSAAAAVVPGEADQLFNEAADQLDQVLQTTEEATSNIMDIIEKHMDIQSKSNEILHSMQAGSVNEDELNALRIANDELNQDLMEIMTTLSFQDLTGQRIKLIISALKKVERIVLDLYLSTGLKMKAREKEPEKSLEDIDADANKTVNDLKGPQSDVKQNDVDDLLAQLGL
ncbi:protein phosphatase CheZ [Desulfovibrio inopinatus]|uniref:protein phosphatase CheZ n=1 Tax=Desulfovibrio inopinatus TaxID=102109 RepID=UPI0004071FC5|nr:protein phosphatase CheZ [Desulfovibrio inopinatus]